LTTYTLPDVPGLAEQPTAVRRRLAEIADAHGWDADGMAACIAHESAWDPAAKNPGSSATGLIQITDLAADFLDTTTSAVARMDALEQLDLAERYWLAASGGNPVGPRDWLVLGLGTGNVGGYHASLPDSAVLYPAGSKGALGNPGLQDVAGNVTVGKARQAIDRMLSGRMRLPVVAELDPTGPVVATALGVEAAVWVLAGGWLLWRALRHGRAR
jgi:hypothetical protein